MLYLNTFFKTCLANKYMTIINILTGIIIFSLPFIILYLSKINIKNTTIILKVFFNSFMENKTFFLFSIFFSIFTGYFWQTQINETNVAELFSQNIKTTCFFCFCFLSMDYIKDLLILPFFNTSIMKMKQNIIKSTKDNFGEIQTAFTKTEMIQVLVRNIFNLIKNTTGFLTAIYYIYHCLTNKLYGILLFCLIFFYIILSQFLILHTRRLSWASTVKNREKASKKILSNDYIKQGLISIDKAITSTIHEKNKWQNYWLVKNVTNIILIFLIILFISISEIKNPWAFYFNLKTFNSLYNNIRSTTSYLDDLLAIIEKSTTQNQNNSTQLNLKNSQLILKNVYPKNKNIQHLFDPINFTMTSDIIILNAANGTGKSTFTKMIANLIEYNGEILKPKTIQINNELFSLENINHLSKGEKVNYFINLIIEHNLKNKNNPYKLIILDEILDCLSNLTNPLTDVSLQTILNKLFINDFKLIIVTHNNQFDLSELCKKYNKTIEKFTISNKKIVKI